MMSEDFQGDRSIVADETNKWIFIGLNSAQIASTLSKIILIFVELNADEEKFNLFNMTSTVGKMNLDIEFYPDIAKGAILGLNFLVYYSFPMMANATKL